MIDHQKILVWDWPVRVGHWLLVILFALAWLTGDSEELRLVHAALGGALVGILLFRVLWGLIGTYHARFASFVRGRQAVWGYIASLLIPSSRSQEPEYAGHNAAAGWAILALLGLGLLTGVTGWVAYQGEAWEGLGEVHEFLASAMLGVALFHIAGVAVSSLTHGENLTWAMFSGYKLGRPDEAIANAHPLAIPLMLAWVAACAWWSTL